jgi:hypothetical protein
MHDALPIFIEGQMLKSGCTSCEVNAPSRVTGSTHAYLTKIHESFTTILGY